MDMSLYDRLLKTFKFFNYKIEDIKDIAIVDNLMLKDNSRFEERVKQISDNCTQRIGYFKRYNIEAFLNMCKIIPFDANKCCVAKNLTIYMKDGNFFQYTTGNYMIFFDTLQTNNNVASKQLTIIDCFYLSSIIYNEYYHQTSLNDRIIMLIKYYFYKIFDKKDDDYLTSRYIYFPYFNKFYLKYNNDLYSFEDKGDDCYYALMLKKNNNLDVKNMICIDIDEK